MSKTPAWNALSAHVDAHDGITMAEFFNADSDRFGRFSITVPGLLLDYSKNRITEQTIGLLGELALERNVEGQRDAMFAGEAINTTEDRAVLHTALRGSTQPDLEINGRRISSDIKDVLERMQSFTNAVHQGEVLGATGKRFEDIIAVGIGGSHLGPEMATRALRNPAADALNVHFVSNVDGHDVLQNLLELNPETTLILVASKTFKTQETMTNASTIRDWIRDILGADAVAQHFVALSSNTDAVENFGITAERMFPFWDWVGGRYSIWSAIGLPIALGVGWKQFEDLLAGAREMDEHFLSAPLLENLPIVMALVGVWNINFLGYDNLAVLPYDQRLQRLPAFVQQLDMESNGKAVLHSGDPVEEATGPVIFGEPGTNGQHAFYQLLHQGPKIIPVDFIAIANPGHGLADHHDQLLANVVAQSQALMQGRSLSEADGNPHRVLSGNRPSNTVVLDQLDARTLGQLIALYEHKVFVQGAIWGINSFDQWGVELGKELAGSLLTAVENGVVPEGLDSSTVGLLQVLDDWRR